MFAEFDNVSNNSIPLESDKRRASIRDLFKKVTPNVTKRATKIKRTVPARLEVCKIKNISIDAALKLTLKGIVTNSGVYLKVNANSSGSKMSGYLQWREKEKKSWKRRWFVLIERVLYVYAASEDIVAIKSVPLLGWKVELENTEVWNTFLYS